MPTSTPAHASPARATVLSGSTLIVLTLVGWTSIPLFLRHFSHAIDPWTANGWRYGISALIWAPLIVLGLLRGTLPRELWKAAIIPSIFNAIGQVCFAIAPYMVEPGLMIFSMRLQIVFLMLGAAVFFVPERRVIGTPLFLVGIAMVIGGTCLTLLLRPGGLGEGTGMGVAIAIAAGIFYAAYALSVRRFMHGIEPFQAFAVVSQYTAAIIVVLMLFLGRRHGAEAWGLDATQFTLLVLSAVIGIGLGHTMYYASIARLGLAVSSGVIQLQPVTVSIGSYFLFGERLTRLQWATGVVAIAGAALMLLAQWWFMKRPQEAVVEQE